MNENGYGINNFAFSGYFKVFKGFKRFFFLFSLKKDCSEECDTSGGNELGK